MNQLLKQARGFWYLLTLYTRQGLYHKVAAASSVMVWGVRMGLTIILYYYIYQLIDDHQAKGVTFSIAVSGMLYFAVFFGFGTRMISRQINKEYRSGGLEVWFNKPLPYLVVKAAETLGKNMLSNGCMLVAFIVITALMANAMQMDHAALRYVCLAWLLVVGLVIATLLYAMIGLSAMFLGSTVSMENIVTKFVMIFGGAYMPIGFFPSMFRLIGEFLPTSAMMYGGQFFYRDFLDNMPRFMATQIVWLVVFSWCSVKLYRKAAKHLSVNGG